MIESLPPASFYSINSCSNQVKPISRTQQAARHVFKEKKEFSSCKKGWRLFVRNLSLIWTIISSVTSYVFAKMIQKIVNLARKIFKIKPTIDTYKLVKDPKMRDPALDEWRLNWALAKSAMRKTRDPILREKIRFSAINYLDKTAVIRRDIKEKLHTKFRSMYQVGCLEGHAYHRTDWQAKMAALPKLKSSLAMAKESPLILTDTSEIDSLLEDSFYLLNPSESQAAEKLAEQVRLHLSSRAGSHENNPLQGLLKRGILIDLSQKLSSCVHENSKFKSTFAQEKRSIQNIVKRSADVIINQNHHLRKHRKHLELFLKKNITCICKVSTEKFSGIKVLPVLSSLDEKNLPIKAPHFNQFIRTSGLFTGAVSFRRLLATQLTLPKKIEYIPQGANALYFPQKDSLTNLELFKRLKKKFNEERLAEAKPHTTLQSKALIDLIEGLLFRTTQEKWENLNNNKATRELLQTSLYRLKEHLATLELRIEDYPAFSTSIELAYAELATLLEFLEPFQSDDFAYAYSKALKGIPEKLKPLIRPGLGKTAVNLFAGIHAAQMRKNSSSVKAHSKSFYFEQAEHMRNVNTLNNVLADTSIKKIDFFCTHSNPNVEVNPLFTHYSSENWIASIKKIFLQKPETRHLTVAIDTTIDFINSPKVSALLQTFEKEILEGKLNIICFKSGQKYDMLGMDNYYGAPFFILNNGGEEWKEFNSLLTQKVHRTDSLSHQWFCLAYFYAAKSIDNYFKRLLDNTRAVLGCVPKELTPTKKAATQTYRVNTVHTNTLPLFVDIKVNGIFHKIRAYRLVGLFFRKLIKKNIKTYFRASFGFAHPNICVIAGNAMKGSTTVRINPGLNPEENKRLVSFLKEVASYV